MTDEGINGDPMDEVEIRAGIKNLAVLVCLFYDSLIEEGTPDARALELTRAYIHGMAGGKLQ